MSQLRKSSNAANPPPLGEDLIERLGESGRKSGHQVAETRVLIRALSRATSRRSVRIRLRDTRIGELSVSTAKVPASPEVVGGGLRGSAPRQGAWPAEGECHENRS
jgi:hypothetical protein